MILQLQGEYIQWRWLQNISMHHSWSLSKQNVYCHLPSCSHIGGKYRNLSSTCLNMSYFHDTVPMWDLTMMEQNHYSVIDSLHCKSFWKSDYLQSYVLRVIISATSCTRAVLRDVVLKIALPSNLVQKKSYFPSVFPKLLFGDSGQADPTTALCQSRCKNTAEVWSCKPRGNPLP